MAAKKKAKPLQLVDAVFEGGGVKGIGLVGAAAVVESKGYTWANLAGTSAGAIVASLLAAGYTATELKPILEDLNYNAFKDSGTLDKIPFLGPIASLLFEKGIYEGDYFLKWIEEKLAAKGVRTFGDLKIPNEKEARYAYKLCVITSDISGGQLVVLPQGLKAYDINPDTFSVAKAVRMSMSIPFFFEPVQLSDHYFVDGGMLSNFPIWLFDSKGQPEWPTFGFRLIEPNAGEPQAIKGPVDFVKALVTTMMDAHDKLHVENQDFARTIPIPTMGVKTTDFDLSSVRRDALYESGVHAATGFFKSWNFKAYIRRYRRKPNPRYTAKVRFLKKQLVQGDQ